MPDSDRTKLTSLVGEGRLALVAAHPDDEIVSAGSQLRSLKPAAVVHLTDGAPSDMRDAHAAGFSSRAEYAEARRRESAEALQAAGAAGASKLNLGFRDQEASLHLAELTLRVRALLLEGDFEAVLTHPYEGGHPDHDAASFAVHSAIRLLCSEGRIPPRCLEFTSYHAGKNGMAAEKFLPCRNLTEVVVPLDGPARTEKLRLLSLFRSQQRTLSYFPVRCERFRCAPGYDFTRPPHTGRLFYENYSWGMTAARWRELAREALELLDLRESNGSHYHERRLPAGSGRC